MKKNAQRLPKGYKGTAYTTRRFGDILPSVLSKIHQKHEERHDLILAAWPQLVGAKIAQFTRPQSFEDGVLKVKVSNSTLYSILNQSEKPKLLASLRKKFPKVEINEIHFRMG